MASVSTQRCSGQADLVKVLLDVDGHGVVEEREQSTSQRRTHAPRFDHVVTTIAHSCHDAGRWWTHTHHEHRELEKSYGESEEYEDKPEEDHDSEQRGYQDEEGGPHTATW